MTDPAEPVARIVAQIDGCIADANPKDGGAPLAPIVKIGNLIHNTWPMLRAALLAADAASLRPIGDGITDDRAAIQAATDAASPAGGVTEEQVARVIWSAMAQLTEYDAVTFDSLQCRPRFTGIRGLVAHAAREILALIRGKQP